MIIPRATYRLQFHGQFTFADAAALVPYLAQLGISHVYASPWLKARPGSSHGYDIVDHNAFNPELGGEAGFEQLHAALQAHGMGQILDFVPNHMGVSQAGNAGWLDVLEWGRASPWADWFDIDWQPADPALRNKLLLPFLDDHYGDVLARGELQPRFDAASGSFSIAYFDNRFSLAPHTYARLITAAATAADPGAATALQALAHTARGLHVRANVTARGAAGIRAQAKAFKAKLAAQTGLHADLHAGAAALAVDPAQPGTMQPLQRLLERQSWRLAYWRVAADEINYRRFFDINELAALRVENPAVFDHIHQLVARLLAAGKLDGLRIDHIDGLFDPADYCHRLRQLQPAPFYLVVEKILAQHEHLRRNWPIDGTTGYDFLNQVTGLLIDARSERVLTRTYERCCGSTATFDDILLAAKLQIVRTRLGGELHVLANRLHRLARREPRTRDYTLQGLTRALTAVVAAFPVYRTYVDADGASTDDRRDIAWALTRARNHWDLPDRDIFDFMASVLTGDLADEPGYGRRRVLHLAMKFQQYTSPVMAKGHEDTAMYRYHRLVALNEVGGDPRQFGISVAAFHHANTQRARHWPQAMLATATHDSKRGEDVRARLAALSTLAPEWRRAVRHWARLNRIWKLPADAQPVPSRNDEYLLYQTLIGAWPIALMNGAWNAELAAGFAERVQAYMTKAVREAKVHSSWGDPGTRYEHRTRRFIAQLLDRDSSRFFLDSFLPLQQRVAERGVHLSLVQLALKLTCPGVPDIYQGCELWDLNLVDPDNRRPVNFGRRQALLDQVCSWDDMAPAKRQRQLAHWRRHWQDGAIKLHVLRRLLALRAAHPDLFLHGNYSPMALPDVPADSALAFERRHGAQRLLVAAVLRPDNAAAVAQPLAQALTAAAGDTAFADVLSGSHALADTPLSLAPSSTPLSIAAYVTA